MPAVDTVKPFSILFVTVAFFLLMIIGYEGSKRPRVTEHLFKPGDNACINGVKLLITEALKPSNGVPEYIVFDGEERFTIDQEWLKRC